MQGFPAASTMQVLEDALPAAVSLAKPLRLLWQVLRAGDVGPAVLFACSGQESLVHGAGKALALLPRCWSWWEGAQGGSPVSASEPKHEALNGSPLDICLRGLPLRREASAAVQFPLLPELLSWCLQHTRVSHLRCLCLSSPVSTWLRGWTSCGTCFGAFPQAGCLESQLALGAQILPDWVVNPQMMSVGFQLRAPCSPPSRCEDLLCLWPRVSWEAFVPGKRCAENV